MNEMVERLALEIAKTGAGCASAQNATGGATLDACIFKVCKCRETARAVIAAMREPTEAMDIAGRHRCHGVDLNDGSMRTVCGGFLGETAAEQWRRMIDTALGSEPP